MIYGNNPQKINEREDALGLKNYTYVPQITAVMQAGNQYVYGLGNPLTYSDPNGEIAITTLILIGSAVIALTAAGITAYNSYHYTGQIDWTNTITTGLSWFLMAYTLGISAYGIYLSYCDYKGLTPVTEVYFNSSASISEDNVMSVRINFAERTLQHEFKHAHDYGISGNWNSISKVEFEQAIRNQILSVKEPIVGTYRGTIQVMHYYNPQTKIDTMIDFSGNYIAGWKLSEAQIYYLLTTGNIQ